jgi:outer membrane protein OmpA-like peptidoglycan-associated protein
VGALWNLPLPSKELRMRRPLLCASLFLLLQANAALAQEKDVEGGRDHPLMTRMPGYYLSAYEQKEFDSYEAPYPGNEEARWEGKLTRIGYTVQPGGRQVSMVQVARNYEAAAKKAGGKILFSDGRNVSAKLEKAGAKTFLQVSAYNDGTSYDVIIVETQAMVQEVVADAAVLKQGLAAEGKVALYGLYFDTGKAVVKPESEPTLVQVVKLLQANRELKLFVVGHTDGVGALETNLKLSADRAAAVVAALKSRGIEAGRLKAAGVGPYSPVSTNRTDEGKAKNRRVELVEQL